MLRLCALRVTLAPSPLQLIVQWASVGDGAFSPIVQWGASSSALSHTRAGNASTRFENDLCPSNSTRWTHTATIDVAPGGDAWWRVSSDGGGTFSHPARQVTNPARAYPLAVALWGDMGVECGGVLPPSPGFAGGQCTAVPALTADAAAGAHGFSWHIGDTAYNMQDRCGAVGDAFLDAAAAYSTRRPHVYSCDNHESGPEERLYPYTEYTQRLAWGQAALAAASGSTSTRWMSWRVGPATFVSLDADAWIYPLCYDLLPAQFAWLERTLAAVDRSATPWLVLGIHRSLYCTKSDDGECNSEASALRDGHLGLLYALEPLLHKHAVDLVVSGHTHHYERTLPVLRSQRVGAGYTAPRASVYVQSGIAGTGSSDPFNATQQPWEAFRDTRFVPTYGRVTFVDDATAVYEQRFNDNGTVFDRFVIDHATHVFA